MNAFLWILQALVALYAVMGSVWRLVNFEQASKGIASIKALPQGAWHAIGAYEILCALGLLLPGIFHFKPGLTPLAAAALTVEMLLLTGLHAHYFGYQPKATNPATWTLALALLSALIAYGRYAVKPL